MVMQIPNDVCQKTDQEIRKADLEKFCRLIVAMTSYTGDNLTLNKIIPAIVLKQTAETLILPFKVEILDPVGSFNPRGWLDAYPNQESWLALAIRAVWQPAVNWICRKLPEPNWLQEVLDAMDPGIWLVEESKSKLDISYRTGEPGRYGLIRVLRLGVRTNGSARITTTIGEKLIHHKHKSSAHNHAAIEAENLARYLPWLIIQEGGRVELLS